MFLFKSLGLLYLSLSTLVFESLTIDLCGFLLSFIYRRLVVLQLMIATTWFI